MPRRSAHWTRARVRPPRSARSRGARRPVLRRRLARLGLPHPLMPLRAGTSPLAVAGALGIVYVVWGSTYTAIVYALESMPPLLLSGSRFLVAGAILVVALKLTGAFAHTTRRHWTAALLTGVPLLAVGNGGVGWGEQPVASGVAALLIASVPLWIAVLDRAVFGRRLSTIAILGLALGFAGIAILVG